MAYIEVQNARLAPNDPRHFGRYPHKVTIIMTSAREQRDMFFLAVRNLEGERRTSLRTFLEDQLGEDFSLSFQEQQFKGKVFPVAVVCCRDLNWIMLSMLLDHQWIGNHTYMVESIK